MVTLQCDYNQCDLDEEPTHAYLESARKNYGVGLPEKHFTFQFWKCL